LETTTTDDATDTQKDQLQRFLDPNQQIKDLDNTITIDLMTKDQVHYPRSGDSTRGTTRTRTRTTTTTTTTTTAT
jgi:hypothetical protein